jgi:hypothetical protein
MGVSGVQERPNTLHSQGLITPFRTSPHWHDLGSAILTAGTLNFRSALYAAYAARILTPEWSIEPKPRHSKNSRNSNARPTAARAAPLPSAGTMRLYWFSISQRPSAICLTTIQIDCSTSSGSKPAITTGRR